MRGLAFHPGSLRPMVAVLLALLLVPSVAGAELRPAEPPRIDVSMPAWNTLALAVDLRFEGTPASQLREVLDFYGDRDDVVDAEEAAAAASHLEGYAHQWTRAVRLDLAQAHSTDLDVSVANATGPVSSEEALSARFGAVLAYALEDGAAGSHIVTLDLPREAGAAWLRFQAPAGFTVTTVQGFSDFRLLGGGVAVEGALRPDRTVTVQFGPGTPLPSEVAMPAPLGLGAPLLALLGGALRSRRR